MKLSGSGEALNSQPPDGGWGWVIVLCGFFNLMMIVGQVNSLGICLSYWKEDLDASTSVAAGIGALLPAIILFTNMFASNLSRRYGERVVMCVGGLIATCGSILASFSTNIIHLYLTISLLEGIGYGLVFQPTVVMPAYYFKKHYGCANGIMFSGIGVGMVVLPPILRILIDEYSWRGTFFILGGISLNMCVISRLMRPVKLEKEKNKESDCNIKMKDLEDEKKYNKNDYNSENSLSLTCNEKTENEKRKFSCIKYFKDSSIMFVGADNRRILAVFVILFMGLASFPPIAHLPYRATVSGITETQTVMLMSLLGMSSLVARILHGIIIDKKYMTIINLYALALFIGGVICMFCTVSDSFTWLVIFVVIFGLSSGTYNPIFIPYVCHLVGSEMLSTALSVILPVFGLTSTCSGIFAGWLFDYTNNYGVFFYYAGGAHIIACGLLIFVDPILLKQQLRNEICEMKKFDEEKC